jgi:hypothetical protein
MDYQSVYDAGAPAFEWGPALVIVIIPIVLAACFYVVEAAVGDVSRTLKYTTWGGYGLYVLVVALGYWATWQSRNEALSVADARIVEGTLTDAWVRTKSQGKRTEVYQHFTVKGVEFLEQGPRRTIVGFLLPLPSIPELPLVEGAHVRITYHGEGSARSLLKFEIAASDLP